MEAALGTRRAMRYIKTMLITLVVLLVILWFLGYIHLPAVTIPPIVLFTFNGQVITLWDVFILLVISAIISALPGPFRYMATALLLLWLLAVFGILAVTGLTNLVVLAMIVGLIAYLLSGRASARHYI